MFKEKYSRDMEGVQPSAELENNILAAIGREKAKRPRRRIKMLWAAPVALLTCCAIVLGLFLGFGGGQKTPGDISTAEGYEEILAAVRKLSNSNSQSYDDALPDGQEAAPTTGSPGRGDSESSDYSGTNVQVEGVDEADVVKTDGKYIYMMNGSALAIFKADGAATQKLSTTDLSALFTGHLGVDTDDEESSISVQAQEMFVYGDRLIVIATVWEYSGYYRYPGLIAESAAAVEPAVDKFVCGGWCYSSQRLVVATLDVSDRTSPGKVSALEFDGWYVSSRMVDGIVTIITNYYVSGVVDTKDPSTFVPTVVDSNGKRALAASDIAIAENAGCPNYILAATFEADGSGELISSKAVFGTGDIVYANLSNIYVAGARYIFNESKTDEDGRTVTRYESRSATDIYRLSNNKGVLEFTGTGSVPGTLINQFAMDEKDGYLRVVTTDNYYSGTYYTANVVDRDGNSSVSNVTRDDNFISTSTSGLYVLDRSLEIVGKIDKLAEGENVYSVRFVGDIGYFVTFRRIDPLFSVDLSNPANPVLLGALKIPGFSEYMHPFGDGLLFGLGQDADEDGRVTGLKLSMFDVSDPTDVSERDRYALKGGWSEAEYNHKAILISAGRNLIAFPGENCYYIFSYSDKGFSLDKQLIFKVDAEWYWSQMRGLFIGNVFYVCDVQTGILAAYEIGSYEPLCYINNAYVS